MQSKWPYVHHTFTRISTFFIDFGHVLNCNLLRSGLTNRRLCINGFLLWNITYGFEYVNKSLHAIFNQIYSYFGFIALQIRCVLIRVSKTEQKSWFCLWTVIHFHFHFLVILPWEYSFCFHDIYIWKIGSKGDFVCVFCASLHDNH